jgi:hypothetical protein
VQVPFVEKIPSIVQGISRQAPSVRHPGQCENSVNVNFNIVDGARKRQGTKFLAMDGVDSLEGAQYRMHRIERDSVEEYAIVYGPNYLKILNINTGHIATPVYTARDGKDPEAYLQGADQTTLRFVTIADSTFIVNTTATPRMVNEDCEEIVFETMPVLLSRTSLDGAGVGTWDISFPKWGRRSFRRQVLKDRPHANWQIGYGIENTAWSVPLPKDATVVQIEEAITGNGVEPNDLVQELIKTVTRSWNYGRQSETEQVPTGEYACVDPEHKDFEGGDWDDYGGTIDSMAIQGIGVFPRGKVIVQGGPPNQRDVEIYISPDITTVDEYFKTANISGRGRLVCGDNVTDPPPPFSYNPSNEDTDNLDGLKIRDIAYLRNRLMIAADEFICFSRIDEAYDFFKSEPPTQTDADPIAVQLAANDICMIDYVIPFRKAIIVLTSSGQQFELSGTDVLAPDTASVSPSTKYETQDIRPVQIGNRLYMVGKSADYATLLEYFYDEAKVSNIAVDLTKHVDNLVPKDVVNMTSSPTTETVIIMPGATTQFTSRVITSAQGGSYDLVATWVGDDIPQPWDTAKIATGHTITIASATTRSGAPAGATIQSAADLKSLMYTYRSYTAGNERKQSAWTTWDFGRDRIQDGKVFDDTLITMRLVTTAANTYAVFESMNMSEAPDTPVGFNFKPHLDHELYFTSGSWNESTGRTTWSIADSVDGPDATYNDEFINCVVVDTDGGSVQISDVLMVADNKSFSVLGNYSTNSIFAGRAVAAELVLSESFIRGEDQRVISEGDVKLSKTIIEHRRSGPYKVVVSSSDSNISSLARETDFTPSTASVTETGYQTVWCEGDSKETTLTLKSTTADPVTWISVETHGKHNTTLR